MMNTTVNFNCVVSLLALSGASHAALVAYFPLDGAAGTVATVITATVDLPSHPVTNGTPNNSDATWVNDATRGLVLDSPDTNRFLAGTQGINLEDGFTWSFWAKVDSTNSTDADTIIGTRNGAWHKITPAAGVDGTGFVDFASGAYNTRDDQWHHFGYVGTDGGSGNPGAVTVTLYIDGVAVGTDTSAVALTYDGQMEIGGSTRFGEYADVLLDDIAIWDEALSESQIQALAAGGGIPEPSSILLLGICLAGLGGFRRRSRS